MPKRSSKRKSEDLNQIAHRVVAEATGEAETVPLPREKDPAAVALGRRGGLVGGRARAASLSAEQRTAIAKDAALKRWAKKNRQP